ncbi:MAG: MATE family efflux transporter [Proteobacteria bacterium]|nr:MATE family efflux transporter [Pseudomonadota bacterium]
MTRPSTGAALRTLLALALPMVLARASQSVVTFADVIQVKHLGPGAIAATATGGLNVFGLAILPMGTVFIVQSFVAQLVGSGQRERAPRYAWYGLAIALVAALVSAAVIPLIGPALSLTGYSHTVQAQMTDYMAIRMLSVGAIVGVEALGNWYGGLGNTWMQMVAGILTMVAAVFFNWVFIDGHLGASAMGVAGAALASVIASWLGFGFLALALWRGWGNAPKVAKLELSRAELRRVVTFGLPNGFNWFLEFAAFQVFVNGVLAGLGDEPVAALNVVIAVNSLSFMPAFGLASAGAILAGQAIGRGEREAVARQMKITLGATMTWMLAIALIYTIAPHPILGMFAEGPGAARLVELGTTMLLMSAAWQVFDATSMTIAETLRAAGDTKWTAIARMLLAWGVFTPSAFIVVRVFDGGPLGAMACLAVYLALLAIVLALRFRTGAWKRIELIEPKLV